MIRKELKKERDNLLDKLNHKKKKNKMKIYLKITRKNRRNKKNLIIQLPIL